MGDPGSGREGGNCQVGGSRFSLDISQVKPPKQSIHSQIFEVGITGVWGLAHGLHRTQKARHLNTEPQSEIAFSSWKQESTHGKTR